MKIAYIKSDKNLRCLYRLREISRQERLFFEFPTIDQDVPFVAASALQSIATAAGSASKNTKGPNDPLRLLKISNIILITIKFIK